LITRRAEKDIETLPPKLKKKLRQILVERVAVNPRSGKKLVGDLAGYWSIRLTHRDRLVYRIEEATRTVYLLRARTHYEP
jgi:Txe/YoeB family toxin of toxin-antitoxin system